MKTMTCKQLGGPCDMKFHAETFEEMGEMSKAHGMEMAEKGDQAHIEIMEKMKKGMMDSQAMEKWMEGKRKEFDVLTEDK